MAERNRVVPRATWHLTDIQTRVLCAILAGHQSSGRIANATGLARNTVNGALRRLRDERLVTWTDGHRGSIVALVGPTSPNRKPGTSGGSTERLRRP